MSRDDILHGVQSAVESLPWVHALWEGGSASFGRVDEWSDVDIGVAVDEGRVEDGFAAVEEALSGLGPVARRWVINPAEHMKPQRMYRFREAGAPLVDLGILTLRTPPHDRYLERRRHGQPRVLFDRAGFTADVPPDPAAWRDRLRRRLADLDARVDFLGRYPVKAARRGDFPEAVTFYQAFVLRPLVEVLRIRHDPWRHDFDVRYLRHDLPEPDRSRLFGLFGVDGPEDLLAKRDLAEAWFREVLASIDVDALPL
jgi:hypothetical protein